MLPKPPHKPQGCLATRKLEMRRVRSENLERTGGLALNQTGDLSWLKCVETTRITMVYGR
jgi:hypothetical protein